MRTLSVIRLVVGVGFCLGMSLRSQAQSSPMRQSFIDTSFLQMDSIRDCPCISTGKNKIAPPASPALSAGREPLLSVNGGVLNYQFLYQSYSDTPMLEKSIAQHNAMLQLDLQVAQVVPVQVRLWTRQTNSTYYRDISDIQFLYDRSFLSRQLYTTYQRKMLDAADEKALQELTDCLDKERSRWENRMKMLDHAALQQKLVEAREVLNIPAITFDARLPDSVNNRNAEVFRRNAGEFIEWYERYKNQLDVWKGKLDTAELMKKNLQAKVETVKHWLDRPDWQDIAFGQLLQDSVSSLLGDWKPSPFMKWLSGIRSFSMGRSPLNSSELTAKNISVNGLAFEYNSWYYLSVAAGGLDYRFRDYGIAARPSKFQPFGMLRLGLGAINGNHLILSGFAGRKAIPGGGDPARSFPVSGLTIEGRKLIGKSFWISGELGQSVSPDYRSNPYEDKTKLGFNGQGNMAYAVKGGGVLPLVGGRIEASYRKTGTNYQSFSTWQVNTSQESWYVKYDQAFFRRRLRLTASLKSNEWQNPYLIQAYRSNTSFKTVLLTYSQRKWPAVTVGYIPVTQLARIGEQVVETRYQMISANAWYQYRLRHTPMASSMAYLRTFDGYDSLLYYQNSSNLQLSHTIFFKLFTSSLAVSKVQNALYRMWVGDHKIQVPLIQSGTVVGVGVKVYNYNLTQTELGFSLNTSFSLGRQGQLTLFGERAFVPGKEKGLMPVDIGSIQFTRSFQFKENKPKRKIL